MARASAERAPPRGRRARLRQAAWFIGLWLAGVAAVAVLGFLIRLALRP